MTGVTVIKPPDLTGLPGPDQFPQMIAAMIVAGLSQIPAAFLSGGLQLISSEVINKNILPQFLPEGGK